MDMLKQQGEERDTFLQTMAEQLADLQNVCSTEFVAVESAYREVSSYERHSVLIDKVHSSGYI